MPGKNKASRRNSKPKSRPTRRRRTQTDKILKEFSQKLDIVLGHIKQEITIDGTMKLGERIIKITQTSILPLRYKLEIDNFDELHLENVDGGFVIKSQEKDENETDQVDSTSEESEKTTEGSSDDKSDEGKTTSSKTTDTSEDSEKSEDSVEKSDEDLEKSEDSVEKSDKDSEKSEDSGEKPDEDLEKSEDEKSSDL